MELNETLENTEHIAHAGHDDSHGHEPPSRLGTYVGITMACLGVLLAFCAAKVGGERTELVQNLVEQSDAQGRYHTQDVKHRVAFMDLQLLHATTLAGPAAKSINRNDALMMANAVDRYFKESELGKAMASSFDPAIKAHIAGQERYETAQLFAGNRHRDRVGRPASEKPAGVDRRADFGAWLPWHGDRHLRDRGPGRRRRRSQD